MFKFYKHICLSLLIFFSPMAFGEMVGNEDLIDPTRPLVGVEQSSNSISLLSNVLSGARSLRVESILIRGDSKLAVINSQRVEEGSRIGSATVISIFKDYVQVNVDGEIRDLPLYQNSIKTLIESEG